MNCEKCVKSTKEKLVIHMHTHKYTIFMSSGATCHCFKKVKNYIMVAKVTKLEEPGNSTDFNLTGNLWKILKRKAADKQPSSANVLLDAIKNIWIRKISVVELPEPYYQQAMLHPGCDTEHQRTYKILTMWNTLNNQCKESGCFPFRAKGSKIWGWS